MFNSLTQRQRIVALIIVVAVVIGLLFIPMVPEPARDPDALGAAPGETVVVPLIGYLVGIPERRRTRIKAVLDRHLEGKSVQEIFAETQYKPRRIRKIIARYERLANEPK